MAFFGAEFRDVGPEVDVGAVGFVEAVVGPVALGAIVGGVEPALVTTKKAMDEFGFLGGGGGLSGEGVRGQADGSNKVQNGFHVWRLGW